MSALTRLHSFGMLVIMILLAGETTPAWYSKRKIKMTKFTKYSINADIPGHISVSAEDTLAKAMELKSDFPRMPRIISADADIHAAIDAAYKTASGISLNGAVITDVIYKMSKEDLATVIARTDKSHRGLHRAAYEMARSVYASGDSASKALALAEASGKTVPECAALIADKLSKMSDQLDAHTHALSSAQLAGAITGMTPADMLKHITSAPGRYLVQAPTAFGKTSSIIEPLIKQSMADGKKVLIISHRRSINSGIAATIPGVVCYSKCTHPDVIASAQAIKIVVNSISAAKYKKFIADADLVIIDEASQVIAHTLGGEVKDRQAVYDTLQHAVRTAKTVLMTDADINKLCTEVAGDDFTLLTAKREHSDITVHTTTADTARALAIESAIAGKKTLIACDVARDAQAIARVIEKSGKKALVITAESAKWKEQAAFIANPNAGAHDVVIYSPVITSALSITTHHFEGHFGIFAGQVSPTDCIQMLRRDRTATTFIVGTKRPDYAKTEQIEVRFKYDYLKALELIRAMDAPQSQKDALAEVLKEGQAMGAFESLRYNHLSAEAWLKDGIESTLPAIMLKQCFRVIPMQEDSKKEVDGYAAGEAGRKAVNADNVQKLMDANAATATQAQKAEDTGSSNESELFSVIRKQAQDGLGKQHLDEDDAKFWGTGAGAAKLALFKKVFSEAPRSDVDVKVLHAIRNAVTAMSTPGIKWTASDSIKLFDQLNAHRSTAIKHGFSMARASTDRAKSTAITKLLTQIGLRTKRRDGGEAVGDYYAIIPATLGRMEEYVANTNDK